MADKLGSEWQQVLRWAMELGLTQAQALSLGTPPPTREALIGAYAKSANRHYDRSLKCWMGAGEWRGRVLWQTISRNLQRRPRFQHGDGGEGFCANDTPVTLNDVEHWYGRLAVRTLLSALRKATDQQLFVETLTGRLQVALDIARRVEEMCRGPLTYEGARRAVELEKTMPSPRHLWTKPEAHPHCFTVRDWIGEGLGEFIEGVTIDELLEFVR